MIKILGFLRGYEKRSVSIGKSSNREFYVAIFISLFAVVIVFVLWLTSLEVCDYKLRGR